MVDSAIPVARATCAMPPYPIACASVAAHTRRDRSVRTGDSAACFARRVARSTSARYYSLIRSTRSYFLTGPITQPRNFTFVFNHFQRGVFYYRTESAQALDLPRAEYVRMELREQPHRHS